MFRLFFPLFLCVFLSQRQLFLLVEAIAELSSASACYGVFQESNSLHLSCTPEKIIVVKDVFALSKPQSSKCPQQQTTNDIDISCCQYDRNDCSLVYKGYYRDSYYNCTEQSSCNKRVSWMDTSPYCDTTIFMKITHYMMINYYCIPGITSTNEQTTLDPCSNARISDRKVFLYTSRQSPFQCNCIIEPMCKMEYRIDALVSSGSSQEENLCEQIKVFSPKNSTALNDCHITKDSLPATLFSGFESMLSFKLINNHDVPGGRFLIHIEGLSQTGQIKISCGKPAFSRMRTSANDQMCDIEDTTTSATTPTKENFQKVNSCESTHNLDCKDPFCLPHWNLNSFFFLCPDLDIIITQGYCAVFSEIGRRVTFKEESRCITFNATCPDKSYKASEIKIFPTCTRINTKNKCYLDDPKCWKLRNFNDGSGSEESSTSTHNVNGSSMQSPMSVLVYVWLIVFLFCTIIK